MPEPITETWLPVAGYEGFYSVSNLGRVRSEDRTVEFVSKWGTIGHTFHKGVILKPSLAGNSKYLTVILKNGRRCRTLRVNRIVCEKFNGPAPENTQYALHRDGNKFNNTSTNLYWGDQRQNCEDRTRHGNTVRGVDQAAAKLDPDKVRQIRRLLSANVRAKIIAADFDVSDTLIYQIDRGLIWRHVI